VQESCILPFYCVVSSTEGYIFTLINTKRLFTADTGVINERNCVSKKELFRDISGEKNPKQCEEQIGMGQSNPKKVIHFQKYTGILE